VPVHVRYPPLAEVEQPRHDIVEMPGDYVAPELDVGIGPSAFSEQAVGRELLGGGEGFLGGDPARHHIRMRAPTRKVRIT